MILLFISDDEGFKYFLFAIGALIIYMLLLRWAVRADSIVKNQETIIHIMIQQLKKQGATDEDLKQIQDYIGSK